MKLTILIIFWVLAGCGSDESKSVEADMSTLADATVDAQSDAGQDATREADMLDDVVDMDPHISFIEVSERMTCNDVCDSDGKECAAYQDLILGLIYGEAQYGETGGAALACDRIPDATMESQVSDETLVFTGMKCGCQ